MSSQWVKFEDFYDLLLIELPGCTTALVDKTLVEIAREFCSKTDAWTLAFDPIDLLASQADYELAPPAADTEMVRILQLTIGAELLWEDSERSEGRGRQDRVAPKYQRNEAPFQLSADLKTLTLLGDEVPTADLLAGLVLKASIKPELDAELLPAFMRSQESEAIRFGVLYRLMRMAKKPWTDRELSSDYETRYNQLTNFAAYKAQVGNTREHLRTRKV